MFDFLDKLRAQPIHVRKQIAFVTTFALSLVVASVWWNSSWGSSSATPTKPIAEASTPSPWSVVVGKIKHAKDETFDVVRGATKQIQEVAQESLESAPFGGDVEMAGVGNTALDEGTALDTSSAQPEEDVLGEPIHTRPKVIDANTAQ